MAQIIETNSHKEGKKGRKHVGMPRIDMTPMVDLGFLLLTFFVLTSSFTNPKAMEINMPVAGSPGNWPNNTITVLISKSNNLFWYQGELDVNHPPKLEKTDFSSNGISNVFLKHNKNANEKIKMLNKKLNTHFIDKMKYLLDKTKIKKHLGAKVIIKSSDSARYQNMVDLIDELEIANIGVYAITDMTPFEKELLLK